MHGAATVRRSPSHRSSLRQQRSSVTDDRASDGGPAQSDTPTVLVVRERLDAASLRSEPSTASAVIVSNSLNQKTPARSYFHRSYHGAHVEAHQCSPQRIREQTAELASYALSDAASSIHGGSSSSPNHALSDDGAFTNLDSYLRAPSDLEGLPRHGSDHALRGEAIQELSEPVSPASLPSHPPSTGTSVLTEMLKHSPPSDPTDEHNDAAREEGKNSQRSSIGVSAVSAQESVTTAVDERTALLPKKDDGASQRHRKPRAQDLESQRTSLGPLSLGRRHVVSWWKRSGGAFTHPIVHPRRWSPRSIWDEGLVKPVRCMPAVILGLLLNILDALSYGMILFPLGQPIFANLGPDGISMFYVSCIISQLVYSCGGSAFRGGIGSEMIEVVPFFHKMAFTILARVGEENPKSVLATTILAYSMSSILTGLVFFGMGACRLGSLIGFFPRHILIGCIGGVGWFLVATGLEVSARLGDNLELTLPTLRLLFRIDTVFLWLIPLILAVLLIICQHWIKHPLLVPGYFLVIPAIFYFFVAAIPDLNLGQLRRAGWVFDAPSANLPFYHFYTLYDFRAVNWEALLKTIPAMFALTFFGVLHVPINVPALAFSTGEDHIDVDRELVAHGVSNALSGLLGSIQNYLVYTNSLLFIRSGGNSRVAGILLAFGTGGLLVMGPNVIGYIPIMVVGALIFLLGIELMREALFDTWGRVHRLEYLTIVAIVVVMGTWDFVVGIFVGIVLACVNFVVQTSRKSAIRATYTGEIARSTVRRHPAQYRFLRQVGKQTHVSKLTGYLFFGTIVSVETRIRAMLDDETFKERPIRFLIFDMLHVTGIDFSAAEAFTRINRILTAKQVGLIMCGIALGGEIERSLRSVGLWDEGGDVKMFEDLNSALEYCENELLKTFYSRRDALTQHSRPTEVLDVPKSGSPHHFSFDTTFSSPRRSHLQQAAHQTLREHEPLSPPKWQNFKQPLPLILQTFRDLSDKNEDFWFRACPFFDRREYVVGTTVFRKGEEATGFYLLEDGIFRAEYHLPQGQFYESIVAGTTCGELPFFSGTTRTATVVAERDSIAWLLGTEKWEEIQRKYPEIGHELLKISLKLTSERMAVITSYVLTTAG